jgi:FHA domain
MSQPDFTVAISQNEYLPEGGDDVNAIATVTSPDTAGGRGDRRPPLLRQRGRRQRPGRRGGQFPEYCPERRFRLFGPEMRIGRRSPSRGLEPEIDLSGPPIDPGVSHLHAVLIAGEDGGWTVFDPGSANGTQVNGREMAPGSRVRLRGGDRISLGAWTVLTIRVA